MRNAEENIQGDRKIKWTAKSRTFQMHACSFFVYCVDNSMEWLKYDYYVKTGFKGDRYVFP